MGRPPHEPNPIQRRQIEALAGYGVPEAEIAAIVEIDAKTLRKHYRHELDHGHSKANAKVAENLYRKATRRQSRIRHCRDLLAQGQGALEGSLRPRAWRVW